jgi:hypothetical protein
MSDCRAKNLPLAFVKILIHTAFMQRLSFIIFLHIVWFYCTDLLTLESNTLGLSISSFSLRLNLREATSLRDAPLKVSMRPLRFCEEGRRQRAEGRRMQCSLGFRPRLIAGHQIFSSRRYANDFGGGLKPLLPLVAGRGQETEFPSAFCLLPSAFLVKKCTFVASTNTFVASTGIFVASTDTFVASTGIFVA